MECQYFIILLIATAGKAEHIRKGINNCARMEKKKKISFGLKKTKYTIVKTGKEEEGRNETVKARWMQRIDKCKYLGMTISTVDRTHKRT